MEHNEAHGDKWDALGFSDEEALDLIQESVQRGTTRKDMQSKLNQSGYELVPIVYPEQRPVKICSLITMKPDGNTADAFYPIFEGHKNTIKIINKYTWENGLEGEVEFFRDKQFDLSFYAPFYNKDFSNIEMNLEQEVYLAGLAFIVECVNEQKYEISKGDVYKMALQDFLKDNPGKTAIDFPSVTIHMAGAIILFPTSYSSEYEFRSRILSCEKFDVFNKTIYKVGIYLSKEDDVGKYKINLYASEKTLKGYLPKIGDEIQGALILSGYKHY
ncbi:hypothetical protein FACS1894102_5270 [Spirochaetia bacterium]|nr:hypothetical protein FACS1894102_5270 [Spirochaetia bacterium]